MMNKFLGAVLAIMLLTGCETSVSFSASPVEHAGNSPKLQDASVYVWIDQDTQCQYLHRNDSRAGLTPRLGKDGKPLCGEASLVNRTLDAQQQGAADQ